MTAFSNGFEWDCWSDSWCYTCVREPECGILDIVLIENTVPAEWTPGTDDLADRYHCKEYESYVSSGSQG